MMHGQKNIKLITIVSGMSQRGQINILIDSFVRYGLSLTYKEGGEVNSTLLRNEI